MSELKRPSTMHLVFVVLPILVVLTGSATKADEDSHDQALEALGRGEILPLSTILERLQGTDSGQVIAVELEAEHGGWVYEVTTLAANGVVRMRLLDAATGRLLPPQADEDLPVAAASGGGRGRYCGPSCACLGQAGYAVDRAAEGDEAHFLGETEPYDAVILDLGLPRRDGLSILRSWARRAGTH